ncbi:MAG: hypothetical protein PHP44_01540 [Kiritimatiellae bacterium]|nr:hypothetical protein [Kiritimatiellia bacterium]MDD4734769.1 hypothetical protein [Kiritimatiellia bacterium]
MWGIEDPGIVACYALCIAASVLCVVYGFINWNRGDVLVKKEDVDWAKEEKEEIEDAL